MYSVDATLSEVDLSNTDLSGANLRGADLSGSDLSSTNLSGANLDGPNLRDSKLEDANLRDTNLTGAALHGAQLTHLISIEGSDFTEISGLSDESAEYLSSIAKGSHPETYRQTAESLNNLAVSENP